MQYIKTFLLLTLILALNAQANAADKAAKANVANEQQKLIAVLGSDAPPAEKALACKRLAIVGDAKPCRPWRRCFPARNFPPGPALPWRSSPIPRPTTPCERRPASCTVGSWSA